MAGVDGIVRFENVGSYEVVLDSSKNSVNDRKRESANQHRRDNPVNKTLTSNRDTHKLAVFSPPSFVISTSL